MDEELAFLLGHDADPFCRWEAGQTLLRALLTKLYNAAKQQKVRIRAFCCSQTHCFTHTLMQHIADLWPCTGSLVRWPGKWTA